MRAVSVAAGAGVLQLALAKPFFARHAGVERRSPQVYGFPSAYEPVETWSSSILSSSSSSSSSYSESVSTTPRVPYFTTSSSTSTMSLSTTASPITPTSASEFFTSTLTVVSSTQPIFCSCPTATAQTVTVYMPCPTTPPYSSNSSSSMTFPTSVISSSIESRIPYPLPTTNISAVFPTSSRGPPYSYSYPIDTSSTVFPTSPVTPSIESWTPFPHPTKNTSMPFPTSPVSTSPLPSYPYPTLNSTIVFPTSPVTSSIESRTPYPLPTTNTSCTYPTSPFTSSVESRTPFLLPTTNSWGAFPTSPVASSTLHPYPYPSLNTNTTVPPSTISSAVESRTAFPVWNSSYTPPGPAVSSIPSANTTVTLQTIVTNHVTRTLPLATTSISPMWNSSSASSVVSPTTDLRTGGYSESSSSTFVVSIATITDLIPTSSGMSTIKTSPIATTTLVTSSSMQTPGPSSYPSYPTGIPSYGTPPQTDDPSHEDTWLVKKINHLIAWLKKHLGKLEAQG